MEKHHSRVHVLQKVVFEHYREALPEFPFVSSVAAGKVCVICVVVSCVVQFCVFARVYSVYLKSCLVFSVFCASVLCVCLCRVCFRSFLVLSLCVPKMFLCTSPRSRATRSACPVFLVVARGDRDRVPDNVDGNADCLVSSWQRDFLAKTLGTLPAATLKDLAQRMVLVRKDGDVPEGVHV